MVRHEIIAGYFAHLITSATRQPPPRRDQINIDATQLTEGIKQIRLVGRLDMKSALLIDSAFREEIAVGEPRVLLDISAVDFMASTGIRLLLLGAKTLAGRGGLLVMCGAQPNVAKTLELTGIDQIIPMFKQPAEAISRLVSQAEPRQP